MILILVQMHDTNDDKPNQSGQLATTAHLWPTLGLGPLHRLPAAAASALEVKPRVGVGQPYPDVSALALQRHAQE